MEFGSRFHNFFYQTWMKSRTGDVHNSVLTDEFRENPHFTYGPKWIYICTFHIYWLSLVQSVTSHLHIMLLNTGGFHGTQQREYCTSVMGIYSWTVKINGILRLKNAVSQSTLFAGLLQQHLKPSMTDGGHSNYIKYCMCICTYLTGGELSWTLYLVSFFLRTNSWYAMQTSPSKMGTSTASTMPVVMPACRDEYSCWPAIRFMWKHNISVSCPIMQTYPRTPTYCLHRRHCCKSCVQMLRWGFGVWFRSSIKKYRSRYR